MRQTCWRILVIAILSVLSFLLPAHAEAPSPRVWLGLQLVPLDGESNVQMVRALRMGGPAHKAGLKTDDHVLTINGEAASIRRLDEVLQQANVGEEVVFQIRRGESELSLRAVVEPMPKVTTPPPMAGVAQKKGWFGIGLEAASNAEQQALGVKYAVPKVTRVFRGSPAEMTGMQVGDVILKIDHVDVKGVRDMVSRVGAYAPGTQIAITLSRKGATQTKPVVLDLRPDMRSLFVSEWRGRPMPDLSVLDVVTKERVSLAPKDTAGSILIIDYFATWCGPCKRVMPKLADIEKRYSERGVRVIGVSSEALETVSAYRAKHPPGYAFAVDDSGQFRQALNVSVLPTLWIVDRSGVISDIWFGAGHTDKLEARLRAMLEGAPE
ncbi:MAG: PDZ domain-containing protein [Myxococcota bacterium]|nr:PDZ domain-containing protein [Myxococcota bacterium]